MYKHTTQKFVELLQHLAETAYSNRTTVDGLSPVALLAFLEEFTEQTTRIAELEAQLAAVLTTGEAATDNDGRLYSEGCHQ